MDRFRYATPTEKHTNRIKTTFLLTGPGPETGKTFSDQQFRMDPGAYVFLGPPPGRDC